MPIRRVPSHMPEEIAVVVEIMTNAVRTEILRHLTAERLSVTELVERVEFPYTSVRRHLLLLWEAGLIETDHPDPTAPGRDVVRWSTNVAKVREIGSTWVAYATGADDATEV